MSALDIARALVRIPSVNPVYDPASPGEGATVEWAGNWGRENGFEVSTQPVFGEARSNIILKFRNGVDHPHLLFNGHLDTVGVGGMTIDPFGAQISDGRLFGRGSCDMKGPNACMMAACARLRDRKSSWRGTLTLAFTVDEEYQFTGVTRLMELPGFRREGIEYAVVAEPSSMRVVRGCKGCLRFKVHATGKSSHSSVPERGRSAVVAMAEAVLALDTFFKEHLGVIAYPEFGTSTGSVGIIEGGSGINVVPEKCTIHVDVRLLPGQDWKQTYREIQACVRAHATRVPDVKWTFDEPLLLDIPLETKPDEKLVRVACEVTDTDKPQVVFYGADVSKIGAAGIPAIILGPGDIAHAHTAAESIGVDELEPAVQMYVKLVERLMPA